jgi:hypothetical protein
MAFAIAFERRHAYAIACASSLAMLGLLVWNSGGLKYYSRSGWEFYAQPVEVASIVVVAVLFGLLVPLQLAAIRKARASPGTASGLVGTVTAVAGMSCCAPLLLPAVLSFVGFSGTALLGFNASMRRLADPLQLASVALMAMSIALVSRTLTAACRLPDEGRPVAQDTVPEVRAPAA